jgi:hypothetical protein
VALLSLVLSYDCPSKLTLQATAVTTPAARASETNHNGRPPPAIDEVTAMTNCDIYPRQRKEASGLRDAKMASVGSWFYGCREHFADYGCELGEGTGRRIEEECPGGLRREVYFGQSIPSFVENVLRLA